MTQSIIPSFVQNKLIVGACWDGVCKGGVGWGGLGCGIEGSGVITKNIRTLVPKYHIRV